MPKRIALVASSPEFKKHLGRRIYDARKAAGMTQAELAKQLGVSTSWVTNIEQGEYGVDLQTIARIASILDYPIEWFLSENGTPPNPFRIPQSRAEWEVAFPNEPARANAHWSIDQVFRNQNPQLK